MKRILPFMILLYMGRAQKCVLSYTDKKVLKSAFLHFVVGYLLRLSFQCRLLAIDCFLFIYAEYIDAKFAFKSAQ